MTRFTTTAWLAGLALMMTTSVQAQDAAAVQENAAETEVAATSGEEWAQFSNNDRTIYLIDLKSFKAVGDATATRIARVPTQGEATNFTHRIDEYEIKCSANQARMMVEIEFDDQGNEVERYPEADAVFEALLPTSLPAYFKAMPCEGARPDAAPAPSIKAFIERGRH